MAKPKESRVATVQIDGGMMTGDPEAIAAMTAARKETTERETMWPKTAEGHVDTKAAMTRLVRMFPSLENAPGVDPFDGDAFLAFACSGISSGTRHAAKFILSVWNPAADWNELAHEAGLLSEGEHLEPFNLHDALGVWDYEHRDALTTWIHCAFWP